MSGAARAEKCFAVDIMLGKLTKWLRVLGFDARSMRLQDSAQIASLVSEGFIPVTRKEKLRDVEGVIFIHGDRQFQQLRELVSVLEIGVEELRPFSRCSLCNAELLQTTREAVFGAVPDYIFETASDFRKCPQCSRVYWPGSHREKIMDRLEAAVGLNLRGGGKEGGE
jgi:hypothetical protein